MTSILELACERTNLSRRSVEATIALLEQGATVPFIARYRQGMTGGLDESDIRLVEKAFRYATELVQRKETILRTIDEQGKLTPELRRAIEACNDAHILEDLYLPYKPKRKTKASVALEQGLGPLAELMRTTTTGDADQLVRQFINGEICTRKEAIQGAQYILAEQITERADIRQHLRTTMQRKADVTAKMKQTDHKEAFKFELYKEFSLDISRLKSYQWLALNRGERLGILSVGLSADIEGLTQYVARTLHIKPQLLFYNEYIEAVRLALTRYLEPSIEREVRKILKESADTHAVKIFSQNLRNLLLQPPLAARVVMGIDPGFTSGCKIAVVGRQGEYLAGEVIYPTPPRSRTAEAEAIVLELLQQYDVEVIAIGNGTAGRETELFISELIKKHGLSVQYLITSEAGASVYSASELARQEFPDLDATQRGNISIARRVQDPLAELVKIDPQSLGVGLYQHDVDQQLLEAELQAVVESCVNEVGVDLNTASARLLSFVSGLNQRLAGEVVAHRTRVGRFGSRAELMEVKGVGEKVFEQAAGFLRIRDGVEPLDNTAIHPESYAAVRRLAERFSVTDMTQVGKALQTLGAAEKQELLQHVGLDAPTLDLITANLLRPGRDPREDVPPPLLRTDVLKMEDLLVGMEVSGTVRNVVDFGAFVDIGLKNDALLHISKMGGGRRVHNPLEIVQVGDVIKVAVETIDLEKQRVSLAMGAN